MSDWQRYEEIHGRDHTVTGTVVVWRQLASPQLGGARDILAYLPPSLAERLPSPADRLPSLANRPPSPAERMSSPAERLPSPADQPDPDRRYPVVYFHDGQNVFDERTSFSGEWQADETLEQLAGEGLEAIAVAIPNGGDARMDEYNPWRDTRRRMGGKGDAYLQWVVDHVKPMVDRTLPTDPGRATTGICGSSMGGLISLYALAAHPDVFGLAAAMSPSLSWNDHRMVELVRQGRVPRARIHLDAGGREWRGMLAEARRLRDLLLEKGFAEGRDLQYVEERFGTHRESAWARRLPAALRFLLAETQVPDGVHPIRRLDIGHADVPGSREP